MRIYLFKSKRSQNVICEKSILVLFVLIHSPQRIAGIKGKCRLVHVILDVVMSKLVCGLFVTPVTSSPFW